MESNPAFTFSNFVPLRSNRDAYQSCIALAVGGRKFSNPLLIYGATSVGKTHLLHAVANDLLCCQSNLDVKLMSCQQWGDDLITAIKTDKKEEQRAQLRACDVLLVDDLQYLNGMGHIQKEFRRLVADLSTAGKRIALAHSGSLDAIKRVVLIDILQSDLKRRRIVEMRLPNNADLAKALSKRSVGIQIKSPTPFCERFANTQTEISSR